MSFRIIFGVFLAAIAVSAPVTAADKVRLLVDPSTLATVAVIGHEKGFFKKEAVDVEMRVTSSRNLLEALISGNAEFILTRGSRTGPFAGAGHEIVNVALARYGHQNHVMVPMKDKTSKTMADLKGKTVGVQVGTGTHATWLTFIAKLGLSEKDFVIKNIDGTSVPAALESGAINAGVTWEPFGSMVMDKKIGRPVATPDDYIKYLGTTAPGVLMSRWAYIKSERDTAQKFVNGWVKAMHFVNTNKEETVRIMDSFFKQHGVKFTTEEVHNNVYRFVNYDRPKISEADIADMQEGADLAYSKKQIKQSVDVRKYVDTSLVENALKRQ